MSQGYRTNTRSVKANCHWPTGGRGPLAPRGSPDLSPQSKVLQLNCSSTSILDSGRDCNASESTLRKGPCFPQSSFLGGRACRFSVGSPRLGTALLTSPVPNAEVDVKIKTTSCSLSVEGALMVKSISKPLLAPRSGQILLLEIRHQAQDAQREAVTQSNR